MTATSDPTRDEMLAYLAEEFPVSPFDAGADQFDREGAIYWFAANYHGGQSSHLYSALSMSEFRPGPAVTGPETEEERDMYDALVAWCGFEPEGIDRD